ncbi:hypothetical protein C8N32_104109 [Rhodovulum imhoffii]|uniref:Uncharacterized protein n=1 Tax=Rhodovulum imhoffii TaxID=365340 RepID=A0A2T5BU46_9RHOB|nr:GNAT family N-acetyltransferase [Rhodovulum imhoffii]MBK5934585.1 GNAT family N-acetyltransferase [Rhodovulum imhoffii]PTN02998.1 hypothetical protein C8N32_104109 [Rhodovulum imhoffii]
MDAEAILIEVHDAISAIPAADWDACAGPDTRRPDDPFTTHRFLHALEESGSVGPGTGWTPHHLAVRQGGRLIGVAPLYAKTHSQGEYIFDHGWAQGYEAAGGRYYPKLQIAVPFTPATGRRFLTRPGAAQAHAALVQGAVQLAAENGLSSLHVTYCTAQEAEAGAHMGLLHRVGQQFHWHNAGYTDFNAFLANLSSRKRKTLRRERARAQGFGGTIRQLSGDDIKPRHWDAFWRFYQDTGARKWGRPYLTRAFFEIAHDTLRNDMMLVLAERDGTLIAGALNFIGRTRLFGRYWGTVEDHPCLHFECCYYQAIDYAIAHGLSAVEAGAQGLHKLARGYLPVQTHSLHWIADPGLRAAVTRFVEAERTAVGDEIEVLTAYGPFRKTHPEEQP